MKYSDLQKRASALGFKSVGVSKVELEKMIASTEGAVQSEPATKSTEEVENVNTAIVLDKSHQEVRRYTIDLHGESFADLAHEFANDRGYKVVLDNTRDDIKCPNCGHILSAK